MKPFTFLLTIPFLAGVAYAQQYPDVSPDKLLSKPRQVEMGLQKLTSEERENLRVFVIEKFLHGLEEGKKMAPFSQIVESQIDGNFKGWQGDTMVRLTNGQIWRQSGYSYSYTYTFRPKVLICRSGRVSKMWVEGDDEPVDVIQLK